MLLCSFCASSSYGILNTNPKINTLSTEKKIGHNKWIILFIIKSPSPQMDSTNVQIHFSCLTQDESKYPAQCNEKGSDKKTGSYLLKMWAKPRKAMAYD